MPEAIKGPSAAGFVDKFWLASSDREKVALLCGFAEAASIGRRAITFANEDHFDDFFDREFDFFERWRGVDDAFALRTIEVILETLSTCLEDETARARFTKWRTQKEAANMVEDSSSGLITI